MKILITGIDGYVGWPTALRISRKFPESTILGVDNFGRRRWVEEVGAVSAVPVSSMEERLEAAREHGFKNIAFREEDLIDAARVDQLIGEFRPDVVLHLAAQPSAPYSERDIDHANYTQHNNTQSTRNLLWALKKHGLSESLFVETTTTGVYGAPEFEIPEGFFEIEYKGGRDTLPFPGMGGSWYHMSKCQDAGNLWLAHRQWKLTIADVRTAIVFGVSTAETDLDARLATRFDFDFDFGVVANRFIAMAIAGYPLTVYGKGAQKKPQISLEDAVESLANAVTLTRDHKLTVYNQTTELFGIAILAETIRKAAEGLGQTIELKYIPNPRVEKESHDMHMAHSRFLKMLGKIPDCLEDNITRMFQQLVPYRDTIVAYRHTFMHEKKEPAASPRK